MSSATPFRPAFDLLNDEELLALLGAGVLTEAAREAASEELALRGLAAPPVRESQDEPERESEYQGDLTIVARYLTPTEAHMLCACLNAGGVPAEPGDTNLVQAHSLLTGAVGGACVRVPANFVAEAREVIAAFRRGEFALEDGFDPGEPVT